MFPDGFWWGTAASSTQAEGAAPAADWSAWEAAGHAPRSGDGNGFARRHRDDFAMLAAHGLTQHRLSIEWARIEPSEGKHDHDEIERYRELLAAARAEGVAPWVCLHHFTLPGWFQHDRRGFLDDKARGYYWPRHVAFCAETFGDLVAGWKPINEPVAYAFGGYLMGVNPPGTRDLGAFLDAYRGILLAQRDAWRELRGGSAPVATIHNLSPVFAVVDSREGRRARDSVDEILWGVWLRAERDGILALPGRPEEEIADLREACDLIGFSYYNAMGVQPDLAMVPYPADRPVGPLGYATWPEGLALTLRRLADEVPNRPLLLCELGFGTRVAGGRDVEDPARVAYLEECLSIVEGAIGDGIDLRGVFFWTGVDNYEWHHGYDVAFGLFDREREPRPSATAVAEFVARARRAG
jgi:beta-glucosidase